MRAVCPLDGLKEKLRCLHNQQSWWWNKRKIGHQPKTSPFTRTHARLRSSSAQVRLRRTLFPDLLPLIHSTADVRDEDSNIHKCLERRRRRISGNIVSSWQIILFIIVFSSAVTVGLLALELLSNITIMTDGIFKGFTSCSCTAKLALIQKDFSLPWWRFQIWFILILGRYFAGICPGSETQISRVIIRICLALIFKSVEVSSGYWF